MIAIGFPSSYRQGAGLLDRLGEAVRPYGTRPLVLIDAFVQGRFGARLDAALADLSPVRAAFDGECSPAAIDRATALARDDGCDVIIGMGGGKAIDTAKGVKIETGLPIVIVPTIASNDSPASRLAITYTDNGEFIGPRFLPANPEAIVVDTAIIAEAPTRFFIAGIGDALVTKFEADQCLAAGVDNFFGAHPTGTAMALAEHCYHVVREHGPQAVADVDRNIASAAVESVCEANILLSGLGFEGCGVAAAHAIGMALSRLPELSGVLHGEEVAVGLLAQFVLEGRDRTFLIDQLDFYRAVRLPASLTELGLPDVTDARLSDVAAFAARDGSRLHNMCFPVDARAVLDALLQAHEVVSSHNVANRGAA